MLMLGVNHGQPRPSNPPIMSKIKKEDKNPFSPSNHQTKPQTHNLVKNKESKLNPFSPSSHQTEPKNKKENIFHTIF